VESGGGASDATRNCPHCGAELGAYASFCWECQQSVATASSGSFTSSPTPGGAPSSTGSDRPRQPAPPAPPPPAAYPAGGVVDPGPAPPPRRRRGLRLGPTIAAVAVVAVAALIGVWISSGDDDGGVGSDAGSDPRPGAEHLGQWLTQIATFDGDLPESRVEQGVEAFASQGLEVDVLRSDDFASISPGSWVFYESAWPTGDEAVDRCVEIGRTGRNECLARLLSDDEADRGEVRFVE
jgi:hypothetical protein